MRQRERWIRAAALGTCGSLALVGAPAAAQTTIAPLVGGEDPEYEIAPISAGPFRITPRIEASIEFDDNVLASPAGTEVDDIEYIVRPELGIRVGDNEFRVDLEAFGQFSRFNDFTTENSDTYGASLSGSYSPERGTRLTSEVGFARLAEDRGDPEARNIAGPGPRLIDEFFSNLRFRREGGRLLVDVEGEVRKLDAISAIDADRDFTTIGGRATLGYRVSGPVYATITGFVSQRDFVLPATVTEPDRDATTYGGRVGLSFVDSERVRGRIGVGIFQFDPQDLRLDERTGLSIDASVALLLNRRNAIIIDGFRGDVATFRQGAQARTDTRFSVVGQIEMRHNFYGRVGLRYRNSEFIGSGINEETYGPTIALEFLANRNLSLLAQASVAERTSQNAAEEFERFRTSLTALIRF